MLKAKRITVFLVVALLGLFSCVPVKRISYVQSDDKRVFHGKPGDVYVRPGDEIFIRITSADETPTALTAEPMRGTYDAKLISYTVNEEGMIKLPYLGKIKISGMNLDEASDYIEEALSQYLYLPNVFMRFVNTRVTVLGEVSKPGVYMFDYKNVNILQAVGLAGDITQFGNRKRVLVIRENGGLRTKHYLDLTRGSILESDMYILQSGDIVFVEPMSRKKWGMDTVPYNLILTVISTGLVIYSFVKSNP